MPVLGASELLYARHIDNGGAVFNPLHPDFGAKGDTRTVIDGAITTGTPNFTSVTAGFTPADVTKTISVAGAGAAGVRLVTTISAYVSPTAVTLTANAATTVAGAIASFGTDDTAALNAMFAALLPGSRVLLPNLANFLVSAGLTWANKALHVTALGAKITETTKLAAIVAATSAHDSSWQGGSFVGSETSALYTNGESNPALLFTTCDHVEVKRAVVTGKTGAVHLTECTNSRVKKPRATGILLVDAASTNGTAAYRVLGGSGNTLEDPFATFFGDGILAGFSTGDQEDNKFIRAVIRYCWDQGIYISSGNRSTVDSPDIQHCFSTVRTPAAVKTRGNEHKVTNVNIRDCVLGVVMTGNGVVNDGFADTDGNTYYNGHGNELDGGTIDSCSKNAVKFGKQDVETGTGNNLYPHHSAAKNLTVNKSGQGAFVPLNVAGGAAISFENIHIIGSYKDVDGAVAEITSSVLLGGDATGPNPTNCLQPTVKGVVSHTKVTNAGSGLEFSTGGGVGCKDINVADNNFVSTSDFTAYKLSGVIGGNLQGNRHKGNGAETGIDVASTCTSINRSNNTFDPKGRNITAVGTGAAVVETDLQTLSIAKKSMSYIGSLRIVAWGTITGANNTKTVKLYWGGSVIATLNWTAAQTDIWRIVVEIHNNGAANAQKITGKYCEGGGVWKPINFAGVINTANAVTVKTTGTTPNATDEVSSEGLVIEPLLQAA